jgi:hypothetical protein
MNSKKIKILTITLSLIIFAISLTKNAVVTNHVKLNDIEMKTSSSLEFFISGSIAFLGGGLFEEIIWLANPLCLISIIMLVKDNQKSKKLSFIALLLAISFAFWKEILANEGGGKAQIISLETGYYLWVLSIIVLNIGINSYFNYKKEILIEKENTNA